MIEPIQPGDELFPWAPRLVNGKQVWVIREDWTQEHSISLEFRMIEYFLQFPKYRQDRAVLRMMEGLEEMVLDGGTPEHRRRLAELLEGREARGSSETSGKF
ncbi:hypothetical protein [Rhizobium rhizogenes]|uniref:hypothetical protein n=1 Tax=Rhizobium rhizogenes TaxID=359 RepID=UPI0015725B6D|nr:hypothetical protein [Rhizobium rhizogenes]NTF64954.1 hypothetical protein [Rhizobium rhizogenes]NTG96302.1 hypothetical protein [Rhizobium rhizogenes]